MPSSPRPQAATRAAEERCSTSAKHSDGLIADVRALVEQSEQQLAHNIMGFIYDWCQNSIRDR